MTGNDRVYVHMDIDFTAHLTVPGSDASQGEHFRHSICSEVPIPRPHNCHVLALPSRSVGVLRPGGLRPAAARGNMLARYGVKASSGVRHRRYSPPGEPTRAQRPVEMCLLFMNPGTTTRCSP